MNLPRPENGWSLFFALFTLLLVTGAAVYLPRAQFIAAKSSVKEDSVDISEIISFIILLIIEGSVAPVSLIF